LIPSHCRSSAAKEHIKCQLLILNGRWDVGVKGGYPILLPGPTVIRGPVGGLTGAEAGYVSNADAMALNFASAGFPRAELQVSKIL